MSKGLYELMRMQEIETANFVPNKKEVEFSSRKFAKELLDSGEMDKMELLSQAVRMNTAIDVITSEIKASLPREKQTAFGIEINPVNGRKMIQFAEDEIYAQLQADLKAREELLKLAQTQEVADLYGNIVPKVSVKYTSDSLTIKY